MSLVVTLPQIMNKNNNNNNINNYSGSSTNNSTDNSNNMAQIKNRKNVLQQHGGHQNLGTDHLPILSTLGVYPLSRYYSSSSNSKKKKTSSSVIMVTAIVFTFVLGVVLLFYDQIITGYNNNTIFNNKNVSISISNSFNAVHQNHQQRMNTNKNNNENENDNDDEKFITRTVEKKKTTTATLATNSLQEGTVTLKDGTSIAYYHQPAAAATTAATTTTDTKFYDLVLLHGAAFTKEDWIKSTSSSISTQGQTNNILSMFHTKFPAVSVVAFDLPVTSDHHRLIDLLESATTTTTTTLLGSQSQTKKPIIASLPVAGLVTPSASGKTITDWIVHDDNDNTSLPITKLSHYIQHWIPVASGSVKRCSGEQLQKVGLLNKNKIKNTNKKNDDDDGTKSFDIFAIYGDTDRTGKRVTEQLVQYAGATSLQLHGGHPVYLDSPNEFVHAVGNAVSL